MTCDSWCQVSLRPDSALTDEVAGSTKSLTRAVPREIDELDASTDLCDAIEPDRSI